MATVEKGAIATAARDLGVELPAAYVSRIAAENGGYLDKYDASWRVFPVWDTHDERSTKKTFNDVVRETRAAREFAGLPPSAVAIARGDDGTYLVLLPKRPGDRELDSALYRWWPQDRQMHRVAEHLLELWEIDLE